MMTEQPQSDFNISDSKMVVAFLDRNIKKDNKTAQIGQKAIPIRITYRPPMLGAPVRRAGAATRSQGTCHEAQISQQFIIYPLAPTTSSYTIQKQPVLYWYLSEAVEADFNLTITPIEPRGNMSFLPAILDTPLTYQKYKKGIQKIDLSLFKTTLTPNQEYEWMVTLICDAQNPSRDLTASAAIKYVTASNGLQRQLRDSPQKRHPYIYAESGIWYDSLHSLSKQIAKKPHDRKLREIHATLFYQVDLGKVAEFALKNF
jgi:hypothetical protein